MPKEILVEFSGWIRIQPESVKFLNVEDSSVISGDDYLNLTEDDNDKYILESVIDAQRDSHEGEYDLIDFSIVESEKMKNYAETASLIRSVDPNGTKKMVITSRVDGKHLLGNFQV